METESQISNWRAIEALRAGVPNRDAVRMLGCSQPKIEEHFRQLMSSMTSNRPEDDTVEGLFVAGDYGCGKSHLLEYLQHLALENNFICSKIAISKQTTLFDPSKLYTAAIQSARTPDDYNGLVMERIIQKLKDNKDSPQYANFFKWLEYSYFLSSHFAATVGIAENMQPTTDGIEIINRISRFWAGDKKIGIGELRKWLGVVRKTSTYVIDAVKERDLAWQRYHFTPRLILAAGYSGWIILVDEVESISNHPLKQRAKSYAQIARLLGKLDDFKIPGLACVLSISLAYEGEILNERDDESKILGKLSARPNSEDMLLAGEAEKGIKAIYDISKKQMILDNVPNMEQLYAKVAQIHANAYDWNPPNVFQTNHVWRIREHIKRWVNELDLRRLYPEYDPNITVDLLQQDLSERPEFEEDSDEDSQENDANT